MSLLLWKSHLHDPPDSPPQEVGPRGELSSDNNAVTVGSKQKVSVGKSLNAIPPVYVLLVVDALRQVKVFPRHLGVSKVHVGDDVSLDQGRGPVLQNVLRMQSQWKVKGGLHNFV